MVENEHNESETGVPLSPRSARFNNHLPDGVSRRFVAKNLSQVFGENQKASIPRQARPIIQRVESEKCGYGTSSSPMMMSPPAASSSSNSANSGSAMMMAPWPIGPSTPSPELPEFRERVQTAPTILRRQRQNSKMENNNTEDSLDEIGNQMEMPKPHQETKKGQKHRFPFKKNRDKQETKVSDRRRIRQEGQLTPGRGENTDETTTGNGGTTGGTLRARSASTSTTERRRRTRRRRGNRKSGSTTGLDNDQIEKMSLEEALHLMGSSREGQQWKHSDNLQCQVINGTTYFTPVGTNKTKESFNTETATQQMSAPTQSSFDDFDFEKVSGTASNNGWSPDSGDNKGLYDNGDTGTSLFPEFKPRGFTKSEPMQRRTLKTGIPSKWNAAYEGTNGDSSELSELKSKMSEFKSLWVANEKKKELDEVEQVMASTAEETAMMALIDSDHHESNIGGVNTKINKNKICKLWESKEANSTDMWEVEKPISSRVSPTVDTTMDNIWSPPTNDMSSLRINAHMHHHHQSAAHLGIEAPSSDTPGSGEIWSPMSNTNWNPIPS